MKGGTLSSADAVDDRQVKRRTSEPCSEISEINEIKLTDVTEALIKKPFKKTMESNEMMAQTVNVQLSKVNTQITNMNVEGNAKFKEMEER